LESSYDYVRVYDGHSAFAPLIATLHGSSVPAPVTAKSGTMFVKFTSDGSVARGGFTADYTTGLGAFELKTSGRCSAYVQTIAQCNEAAIHLGLSDWTASDDRQSGVSYDPPGCYYEGRQLKLNTRMNNRGWCTILDKCLCRKASPSFSPTIAVPTLRSSTAYPTLSPSAPWNYNSTVPTLSPTTELPTLAPTFPSRYPLVNCLQVHRAFMAARAIAANWSENATVNQAASQLASMLAHDVNILTEARNTAVLFEPYKAAIPATSNETRQLWRILDSITVESTMLLQLETPPITERSITLPRAQAEQLEAMIQSHHPEIEKAGVESTIELNKQSIHKESGNLPK